MDTSLAPRQRFPLDHAPDERTALTQFLDIHRIEFHERAWGLTDEHLRQTAAASDLTLGALVKHMALVEHTWFEHRFAGRDEREPWASAPWDDDVFSVRSGSRRYRSSAAWCDPRRAAPPQRIQPRLMNS